VCTRSVTDDVARLVRYHGQRSRASATSHYAWATIRPARVGAPQVGKVRLARTRSATDL